MCNKLFLYEEVYTYCNCKELAIYAVPLHSTSFFVCKLLFRGII